MAEQPQVSEDVTPKQFFEQLLPMGFAAQSGATETGTVLASSRSSTTSRVPAAATGRSRSPTAR